MVVPVVTYCGTLNLGLATGQLRKLAALRERTMSITGVNSKECSVLSPESCVLVHNILNNDIREALQRCFKSMQTSRPQETTNTQQL